MEPRSSPGDRRSCKCRVLVVENELSPRADHVRNLRLWGFEPVVAEGVGQSLLADAQIKASQQRCQIALVDKRLLDDNDPSDTSGLDLVPSLPGTRCILVTGFGDLATTRKALKEKGVEDVVGKEEGPRRLKERLDLVASRSCSYQLAYRWPSDLAPAEIIRQLEPDEPDQAAAWQAVPLDEPDCLIKRLYAPADHQPSIVEVQLRPLFDPYRSPTTALGQRRSVVLWAKPVREDSQPQQREVIKLAPRTHIQLEIANYYKHVRGVLPRNRAAQIDADAVLLWDMGGIRYTDETTDDREPMASWYVAAGCQAVKDALHDLFEKTLEPWYGIRLRPQPGVVIYDLYLSYFPKLAGRLQQCSQVHDLRLSGLPLLPNPVTWAAHHAGQGSFLTRVNATVHGDLHADNVFVNGQNQTSVIDYERCGRSYMLRDFVELDKDIRLRLLPLSAPGLALEHYDHLERLLLAPNRPGVAPQWQHPDGWDARTLAAVRKAFDAVVELRQLACDLTGFADMDEYYWALLMETLVTISHGAGGIDEQNRLTYDRAMLAAALICQRLENWGQVWPN